MEINDKILSFEKFENVLQSNYNSSNALLLYAIFNSEQEKGAELKNIIGYIDYANHAIITFKEFNNGIKYLFQLGLVKEIDKRLIVNSSFKEWYNKKYKDKKRIYVWTVIEKIQDYLNNAERTNVLIKNLETQITEIDFDNGVNEYLK